jgi:subtilisin family serine protease
MLCVGLWLVLLLPLARPNVPIAGHAQAQNEENPPAPIAAEPTALAARVEFGDQRDVVLTITNESDTPFTPRLYEARAVPPPQITVEQAPPPELQRVALPEQRERVDPQIFAELDAAPSNETEFLVFLGEQPDLSAAYQMTDWHARGWYVYRTLHEHANRSQSDLRSWLELRGLPYQPLWIVNAIKVRGTDADVQTLAARADVAMLRANYMMNLPRPEVGAPEAQPAAASFVATEELSGTVEWNIDQIDAERVWQTFGVTGDGVTVATIDSGVFYEHPALREQYRGYRAIGEPEHAYNWYDPSGVSSAPVDDINHGTHVMGTISGRGGGSAERPFVGVAPGIDWIAARGCLNNTCRDSDLIASAQWILAPTDQEGKNPRPDLRPHVVNNSWASESTNDFYISYTAAWRAAGIFPVFAAGNSGHAECSTAAAPGNYTDVFAVGASNTSDTIASFSSIGPGREETLKPDLVAPGIFIRSTVANTQVLYAQLQGTSMAAPHVSGAVALLWSANPLLIGDYEATYELLTSTALPRTDTAFDNDRYDNCRANDVPNNVYGHGRLDTYAAVAAATVDVPWLELPILVPELQPGASTTVDLTLDTQYVDGPDTYRARVLVGTGDLSQTPLIVPITLTVEETDAQATVVGEVYDLLTGIPLAGKLFIDDRLMVPVVESGTFTVTLPTRAAPYTFRPSIPGYASQSEPVTLTAGMTHTLEFSLTASIPRLKVFPLTDAILMNGVEPQPLDVPPEISSATLEPISVTLAFSDTSQTSYVVYNEGQEPLNYTAHVPPEHFGVWRSDRPADSVEQRWFTRPPDATVLALADDGTSEALPLGFELALNGQRFDQIYVGANGLLTFQNFASQYFVASCLPVPETIGPAIVPFRADLDPSQGGVVWAAQIDDSFVVSFEDVPLHSKPPDPDAPTYSFQVVLARDGSMLFTYKDLAALPRELSVGIQHTNKSIQSIGCGETSPIMSDLTLDMRPQPGAQRWIDIGLTSSGTLLPGWGAVVRIDIDWVPPFRAQPYRSGVLFESNDPWYPSVRLPVYMTTEPAPHSLFLPLAVQGSGP